MAPTRGRFRGRLYRALNPLYARGPLSGQGAALFGGRFNPKGMEALHAALDPVTALREANQVGDLQPTTLVAYKADLAPVLDTSDPGALTAFGMSPERLADPRWRAAMAAGRAVPTQDFALALARAGYVGCLVRSFAKGTTPANLNLVLWRWNKGPDAVLEVIDDENRLTRS